MLSKNTQTAGAASLTVLPNQDQSHGSLTMQVLITSKRSFSALLLPFHDQCTAKAHQPTLHSASHVTTFDCSGMSAMDPALLVACQLCYHSQSMATHKVTPEE